MTSLVLLSTTASLYKICTTFLTVYIWIIKIIITIKFGLRIKTRIF